MLKGENIICASWVDWNFVPIIMHYMMKGLARHNRILFVDPIVSVTAFLTYPEGRGYLKKKIRHWLKGIERVDENLYVYYPPPVFIQYGHNRLNDRFNQIFIEKAIARVARKLDFSSPILWFYNPHAILPEGFLKEKLVCFDCNDDLSSFLARYEHKKRGLRTLEDKFSKRADIIFTTSMALYKAKKRINANTYYFPSGVDFDHFNKALNPATPVPEDISHLPHPMIGFVGAMSNSKINWDWIIAIAQLHPEWSLVFIGPCLEPPPDKVLQTKNIFFLGQKGIEILPGYVKAFDVCMIPYKGKEFLESCFPTKSFEYLAAGKPVVTSYIPALEEFRHVVRLSKDEREFILHIEDLLSVCKEESLIKDYVAAARGKTWEDRLEKTTDLITKILKDKSIQR